ncbi:MAG: PQQ-binding-like beta-propeller repeat protein [Planctomycetaceae bacterium]|nr:PQQ-binding-like beta-propeller repeat protein [Planctomycetaceae bacterium]
MLPPEKIGMCLTWVLPLVALPLVTCSATAQDWPRFRGPNSSGVATTEAPVRFGPQTGVLWQKNVGPGHSSPCVANGRIFLTSFDQQASTVSIHSLNTSTGQPMWRRDFVVQSMEKGHPSFNPASSSPACDGQVVVAYFGSLGLVALNADNGDTLWEKRMPTTKSFGGNATSPIIAGEVIVLYRGNYVDHFLLAVDRLSGEELWRVPQTEKFTGEMACTACPIVIDDRLIVHSARSLQCFDLATGQLNWLTKCATTATSTPIIVGERVVVAAWNKMGEPALRPPFPSFAQLLEDEDDNQNGLMERGEFPELWIFHRPDGIEAPMNGGKVRFQWADRNKDGTITEDEWTLQLADLAKFRAGYETHGLLAVPLDSMGILTQDDVQTLETQGIPEVPSPVSDGQFVYLIKNGGVLTVIDATTGRRASRLRTPGRGTHYASPIIAGSHLYVTSGDGVITVLTCGAEPQVVASNKMEANVYATPAVADGRLFVRTHDTLFAFGESPGQSEP